MDVENSRLGLQLQRSSYSGLMYVGTLANTRGVGGGRGVLLGWEGMPAITRGLSSGEEKEFLSER